MLASRGAPVALLIALTLCLASACSQPPSGPAETAVARPQRVLLVTIDTLRADRVGSYGYPKAQTPAMDGLARAGVRFDRAFAPAPITLTSHATLLTGLNPPAHGARHNGMQVRDSVATLATTLADAGFATAAFVSAFPLDRRFGLARGFAVYDDRLPRQDDGRPANERAGASTVDAARAWLDEHRGAPFFLWVHLFEPHAPYGDPAGGSLAGSAQGRYDGEVAEADRQLARLLDALGAARSSTLVAVAADHGEAFGEHGEIAHSIFVYDTTLRVPLVMSGPGVPARGVVVKDAVGLVDVAPTLLALLGQHAAPADGVDLRGSFEGKAVGARLLYAESFAPLVDFGWSPLRVAREGRWKYIAAPRPELYDLDRDAAETRDVLADHRDVAAALAPKVEAIATASLGPAAPPDPQAAARLESLGYVSARARAAHEAARTDPKDRKEIAARIAEITSGEVPPDRLVPALEQLLRDDPGNPFAELRLGAALADRGACDPAQRHLRAAVRAGTPTADPFLSLAYCYRQRGATAEAERALQSAERAEPGNPVVAANRGLIAFDAGRLHDAIELLDAAVTREPDLHMARFFLARAYAKAGQRAPAHAQALTLLSRLPPSAPQRAEVERLVAALADPSTR